MQQHAYDPEEELSRELSHQEREMKNDLYLLNELHTWISNEGVSMEKFIEKSRPLIKKFWEWNPAVAKELEEIIMNKNREAILAYFSAEKEALVQVLHDALETHRGLKKKINDEITGEEPTDS